MKESQFGDDRGITVNLAHHLQQVCLEVRGLFPYPSGHCLGLNIEFIGETQFLCQLCNNVWSCVVCSRFWIFKLLLSRLLYWSRLRNFIFMNSPWVSVHLDQNLLHLGCCLLHDENGYPHNFMDIDMILSQDFSSKAQV